jgi:hypothetical protein
MNLGRRCYRTTGLPRRFPHKDVPEFGRADSFAL